MNVTATDVLGSLFNPNDTVCFRVFDDKKSGVFRGSKLSCECGKYKSMQTCMEGYDNFGFDCSLLVDAYLNARSPANKSQALK